MIAATRSRLNIALLCIGDELIEGRQENTNARDMAMILGQPWSEIVEIITLPDHEKLIALTLRRLTKNKQIHVIVLSGGLGCTSDDRTAAALALAFNTKLVVHSKHQRYLLQLFKKSIKERKGRLVGYDERMVSMAHDERMKKIFLSQARVPEGFEVERSAFGTAPFLYRRYSFYRRYSLLGASSKARKKDSLGPSLEGMLFALPGVPSECLGLCRQRVVTLLQKRLSSSSPRVLLSLKKPKFISRAAVSIKVIGLGESRMQAYVEEALGKEKQAATLAKKISVAYLPSAGELELVLKADDEAFLPSLTGLRSRILLALKKEPGTISYAGSMPLAERLHRYLMKKKWRFGVAESLSGGLLSAAFVQRPGASAYFQSAVTCYSEEAKQKFCNVPKAMLKRYGAVSAEVAEAMAEGFAKQANLDIALSVTGIAGPKGAVKKKPLGTVFIGFFKRGWPVLSRKFLFTGDRDFIQAASVKRSLSQLAFWLAETENT